MNTPGRLVVRVLALAAAGVAGSLVMDAVGGSGAVELLVLLTLGPVATVGAFLDARRAGWGAAVGSWAAAGAALGLVLAVSAPFRNGDWRHGIAWGEMWGDVFMAVPLVAVLVTLPAMVGAAVGSLAGGRSVSGG